MHTKSPRKMCFLIVSGSQNQFEEHSFWCDLPILRGGDIEEVEEWVLEASWLDHIFSWVPHSAGCLHWPCLTCLPPGWCCWLLFHPRAGAHPPKIMWSRGKLGSFSSTHSSSFHQYPLPQVSPHLHTQSPRVFMLVSLVMLVSQI